MQEQSTGPRTEPRSEPGPLGKLVALIVGVGLLVLGFMFSLVILAVVAVAGLAAWGWFWWKTRELRQALREQAAAGPGARETASARARTGGTVIEGEAVIVEDTPPRDPAP